MHLGLLAQQPALQLPGPSGAPINIYYPKEYANFPFIGTKANFGEIVTKAIPFVLAFAGMGLLLMLIAGGYGVLTSSGDAKKLAGAQQRITYAILGFIIIFVAFWLVQILATIFGLQNTGFLPK